MEFPQESVDVTIVFGDGDWEALYLNGKERFQGHSIRTVDALKAVQGCVVEQIETLYVPGYLDPYERTMFPEKLSDLLRFLEKSNTGSTTRNDSL